MFTNERTWLKGHRLGNYLVSTMTLASIVTFQDNAPQHALGNFDLAIKYVKVYTKSVTTCLRVTFQQVLKKHVM